MTADDQALTYIAHHPFIMYQPPEPVTSVLRLIGQMIRDAVVVRDLA